MDDTWQTRIAENEAAFRLVNEAIERGHWPGTEDEPTAYRCECARLGCNRMVALTPHEYEAIRANPRRFFVLPGHELAEVEDTVAVREGYLVVEKRDQAGEVAEATDPRQ
ncbi:MAG TPA: hypothetical protein VGN13_07955 [Solirubrobacteraceae bacterium]